MKFSLGKVTSLLDMYAEKSVLSSFEIEMIKRIHLESVDREPNASVGNNNTSNFSREDDVRISTVSFIDNAYASKYDCHDMISKIESQIDKINQERFDFDIMHLDPMQVTEYDSNYNGHYRMHTDCDKLQKNMTRKLSFIIPLNNPDEYEGGDFIYQSDGENINLSQKFPEVFTKGNIIVFPSFVPHGVNPVLKGTRFTLVGWCKGPRFR